MRELDTYLLTAFTTAARCGTVTGSARILNRTQAAVSMQIRRLEALLATTLFERTSTGLVLSKSGEKVLPLVQRMLDLTEEIYDAVENRSTAQRVRLGVVEDVAASSLPGILQDFRETCPEMEIDIIVGSNRSLAESFKARKLDVVICDAELLEGEPIVQWPVRLVWAASAKLSPGQKAGLPVIMFEETCPWQTHAMAALGRYGHAWRISCEASTLVAMATAVRTGAGVGLMFAETIPDGCCPFPAERAPPSVVIDLAMHAQPTATEPMRRLTGYVGERLRGKEPLPA